MTDLSLRSLERQEPMSVRHRMALVRAGRASEASLLPGDLVDVECSGERFQGIVAPSGRMAQKLHDEVVCCYLGAHTEKDRPTWTLVMPGPGIYCETNAIANSQPIGEKVNCAKALCVRNESSHALIDAVSQSVTRGIEGQSP